MNRSTGNGNHTSMGPIHRMGDGGNLCGRQRRANDTQCGAATAGVVGDGRASAPLPAGAPAYAQLQAQASSAIQQIANPCKRVRRRRRMATARDLRRR